jgi:predicted RecA/RadA family phage recombinase
MAKAIPAGGVNVNRALTLAHTAIVAAGEVIVSTGQVLVAVNATAANAANAYVFCGPVTFPKKAATALPVGTVVYFDETPGEITDVALDGTKAGVVIDAALAADTTVLVELRLNA